MLLLQEHPCVSMLIALDMVTDVAYPDRVGANDPLVAEVLTRVDSLHKLATHLALQLAHHLLPALVLTRAVQPGHRLILAIKLMFPHLELSVSDLPPLSVAPSLLRGTASLHSGRLLNGSNPVNHYLIREIDTTKLTNKEHWNKSLVFLPVFLL